VSTPQLSSGKKKEKQRIKKNILKIKNEHTVRRNNSWRWKMEMTSGPILSLGEAV
jgi:hypothetical protein